MTKFCFDAMPVPHPLAAAGRSLADAIAEERRLLHPLIDAADLIVNTSRTSVHELRDLIGERLAPAATPLDPVPVIRLQAHTSDIRCAHAAESVLGAALARDPPVMAFLQASAAVHRMLEDLQRFLEHRVPEYERANRCSAWRSAAPAASTAASAWWSASPILPRPRYPQLLVRHNALPR